MKSLAKYLLVLLVLGLFIISACKQKTTAGGAALCHDETTGTFVECSKLTKDNKELPTPEVVPSGKIGILIGDSAPDFLLNDVDGKQVRLSDYKGKQAVILDFFATWCPYCNDEMPRLDKLVEPYKGKILMIAVDNDQESVSEIRSFRDKYSFKFPVLVDPDAKVVELYQIVGQPHTFYINREGVIVDRKYGSSTDEDLKKRIEKIVF